MKGHRNRSVTETGPTTINTIQGGEGEGVNA